MPLAADRFARLLGPNRGSSQRDREVDRMVTFIPSVYVDMISANATPLRAIVNFADSCRGETYTPFDQGAPEDFHSLSCERACQLMDEHVTPVVTQLLERLGTQPEATTDPVSDSYTEAEMTLFFKPRFLAEFSGPQFLGFSIFWDDCYHGWTGELLAWDHGYPAEYASSALEADIVHAGAELLDSARPAVEKFLAEFNAEYVDR